MTRQAQGQGLDQKMKILYVSMTNPEGLHGFSGVIHYSHAALAAEVEVDTLHVDALYRYVAKLSGFLTRIGKKRVMLDASPMFSRLCAWLIARRVARCRPDAVVCVAASAMIARCNIPVPIIYCTDATFAAICRLYPAWQNFTSGSFASGHAAEQGALTRAAHIVASSQWASASMASDYGIDPERVTILSYGANLPDRLLPAALPAGNAADRPLNLLYSGFDWQRKGGGFALDVVRELNRRGRKAVLHVVGNVPDEAAGCEFVVHHGLLNRSIEADLQRSAQIYAEADLFILPTKADATPIVLCEASAFGVPSLTFDVGGVSSVVEHGVNGLLFPADASPADVAGAVQALVADPEGLAALSASTFEWSQRRGNWHVWARAVAALARAHTAPDHSSPRAVPAPERSAEMAGA